MPLVPQVLLPPCPPRSEPSRSGHYEPCDGVHGYAGGESVAPFLRSSRRGRSPSSRRGGQPSSWPADELSIAADAASAIVEGCAQRADSPSHERALQLGRRL